MLRRCHAYDTSSAPRHTWHDACSMSFEPGTRCTVLRKTLVRPYWFPITVPLHWSSFTGTPPLSPDPLYWFLHCSSFTGTLLLIPPSLDTSPALDPSSPPPLYSGPTFTGLPSLSPPPHLFPPSLVPLYWYTFTGSAFTVPSPLTGFLSRSF